MRGVADDVVTACERGLARGFVAAQVALVASVIAGLFQAKARYEERWLAVRFAAYLPYASRTPRWLPHRGRGR